MKTIIKLILFLCITNIVQNAHANNMSVANVGLTEPNTPGKFVYVRFTINWENSWRTSSMPNNWDAAWVFIKYRIGTSEWKHATLHTSSHSAPSGSTITSSSDGKGVFIYRNDDGSGSVSYAGVKLRWDYGTDGVQDADQVTVKVFALEMVYVPQGSYYVGSGGSESGSFTNGCWRAGNTIPFQITSEAALTIDTLSSNNLWGTSSVGYNTIGPQGVLSASFPKGYNAFYCMKYSISQRQYVDFLNTLTYDQQTSRTGVPPNSIAGTRAVYLPLLQTSNRNGIAIQTTGLSNTTPAVYACDLTEDDNYNQSNDGQYIECNWLGWADGIAYSDWAGMRPMSEFEFEKACRGSNSPVANEYVWGNLEIVQATSISDSGLIKEIALPSDANSNFNRGIQGPFRVGNFARSSSTQTQAGATYYGIMEMGGGVWERTVTVGNSIGRLFIGSHGDGVLDVNGDASGVSDWPALDAVGAGFRGGVWDYSPSSLCTSDRSVAAFESSLREGNPNRDCGTRGFRAVRTAP